MGWIGVDLDGTLAKYLKSYLPLSVLVSHYNLLTF